MELGLSHLIDARLLALVEASRAFYAQRPSGRGPGSLEDLRATRARMAPPKPSDPPAQAEMVEGCGRAVPVRIQLPRDERPRGVVLDFHGGGFFLGSAAADDIRNRRRADALGVAVVSVDYRLAPEHPWPAAPDDCEVVACWLAEGGGARFGTERLVMHGFSAGSTLAMSTLLRLRDRGVDAFRAAVLEFGTYDLSGLTPGGRLFADEYFLEAYLSSAPDRTVPDASPAYGRLAGLPPVQLIVGSDDILLEDNLAMAMRLSAAGVDVDLRVYPASPHGFTGHATPMACAAADDIDCWLSERLGE